MIRTVYNKQDVMVVVGLIAANPLDPTLERIFRVRGRVLERVEGNHGGLEPGSSDDFPPVRELDATRVQVSFRRSDGEDVTRPAQELRVLVGVEDAHGVPARVKREQKKFEERRGRKGEGGELRSL